MNLRKDIKAQSTVEFTFAMVVIMFLAYGTVQVFRWTGIDLAQRQYMQDNSLVTMHDGDPSTELYPVFESPQPIAAVYHGKITNGNTIRP